MSSHLGHLHEKVVPIMELGLAQKLESFQAGFWIGYPLANQLLEDLQTLHDRPRKQRMAGYLVTSESNNGKSELAKRFAAKHPFVIPEDDAPIRMPVILMELMPAPTEESIIEDLLETLGLPYRPKDHPREKRWLLVRGLQDVGCRVLMIDELQRLLGAKADQRRIIMDSLRYIANMVPIPIVAFSTPRGTGAMASSDEMINRLRTKHLPRWELNGTFQSLLASFQLRLPLEKPSNLSSKEMAAVIHGKSEGLIGEVYDLLDKALQVALHSKEELISKELLLDLAWTAPSERKRAVALEVGR